MEEVNCRLCIIDRRSSRMYLRGSWASLALVAPLWLASCDNAKEQGETRSQPADHIARFGGCAENSVLFTVCEAPLAEPSDKAMPLTVPCPVEPLPALTEARNDVSHSIEPTSHAADAKRPPQSQTVTLSNRCRREETSSGNGTTDDLTTSARESACSCRMKTCGCA